MIKDSFYIPSSTELNTFVLSLPKIKKSYIKNAVDFELYKFFPGDTNLITTDYFLNKSNTLGFMIPTNILETHKNQTIVSKELLIQNLYKNTNVIFVENNIFQLCSIVNGEIVLIKNSQNINLILDCVQNSKYNIHDNYYIVSNDSSSIFDNEIIETSGFKKTELPSSFSKKQIKKSTLFIPHKTKNKYLSFIIFIILITLVLLSIDFSLRNKIKKSNQVLSDLKNQYSTMTKLYNNEEQDQPSNQLQKEYPLEAAPYYLYTILNNYKKGLKLSSISINEHNFKVEGECYNALSLVQHLEDSDFIHSVLLNQVINNENGSQKFLISGRIENE